MKQEIKPINKRISTYRKLAGYTQQAAADALGIKKNTYARMELHGNPTPDMLIKLSKLYNVSPNLILFGIDNTKVTDPPDDTRLNEKTHLFKPNKDLALTVNETNCIRACRELSKSQQKEVMALINKFYNDKKNKR